MSGVIVICILKCFNVYYCWLQWVTYVQHAGVNCKIRETTDTCSWLCYQ